MPPSPSSRDKGVTFHWGEGDATDFTEDSTREQLRDYLVVLDLIDEFGADCIGWQFQIGLLNQRPPSDFAEGLLNSACRPESTGETIPCATEADQGNALPAELMKRLLKEKGLHHAVFMHDMRWAGEYEGRTVWMLCNSGSGGAYAYNQDPDSLQGVHSYRQIRRKFPIAGGTFSGYGRPRNCDLGADLREGRKAGDGSWPGRDGRLAGGAEGRVVARGDPGMALADG